MDRPVCAHRVGSDYLDLDMDWSLAPNPAEPQASIGLDELTARVRRIACRRAAAGRHSGRAAGHWAISGSRQCPKNSLECFQSGLFTLLAARSRP
jgi:hypothetical protein